MSLVESKGAMTVNELIKELEELPDNVKESKIHGRNQEWLNHVMFYTKNGRIDKDTSSNDIRVMISNDEIFYSELKGVESYKEENKL